MSHKKTHEEFMKQVAHRLGEYEVLSVYQDALTKMRFRHKACGTEFEMKPPHFERGRGCRPCSYKLRAEQKQRTKEEFLDGLPAKYNGWSFSGYISATSPITATCPRCGRTHTYSNAKSFVCGLAGCRVCETRQPEEELRKVISEAGWEFVKRMPTVTTRSGKSRVQRFLVRCPKCKVEKDMLMTNIKKYTCPTCNGSREGRSRDEDGVFTWVKQFAPDAEQSDREVLRDVGKRGRELDIYIPSKKVAIEYNGVRYHGTFDGKIKGFRSKPKSYHWDKSVACSQRGIRLIHIWDYEWNDERKRKVLQNIILGAIGQLPERYYARQCEVKVYERGCRRWAELSRFFAENNIQGNRGGSIVLTLEKEGRILMAYKFGRPSGGRAKQKYEYEMVRGASAMGVQVVGGATRLWKHFVETVRPKSVVYYVDYNYFDGRSVERLGGMYVGAQKGVKNYWIKERVVKNREPARHAEIKKKIEAKEIIELWNAGVKTYAFEYEWDE